MGWDEDKWHICILQLQETLFFFCISQMKSKFSFGQIRATMPPRFQCVCVCSVIQLCPTLWNPTDCSPPDSSVHGLSQERIPEWVAISFSRGSSWPRDWNHLSCISCIGRQILYHCATWESPLDILSKSQRFRCTRKVLGEKSNAEIEIWELLAYDCYRVKPLD